MMTEPLSREVQDRLAEQFPAAVQAQAVAALLDYRVAPVNLGRLMVLNAARGQLADLLRLVDVGNRYGRDWQMNGR